MDFIDFQLRAWRADAEKVQVIVQSSPVGSMEQPVTIPVDLVQLDTVRRQFADQRTYNQFTARQIADLGGHLAAALLPPPVYTLLLGSLERIAPDDGLRLRLCLDAALNDLPWEFLRRPDTADESPARFLALDPRISLVRGAPSLSLKIEPSEERLRLVFFGALWGAEDNWYTRREYEQLRSAVAPVAPLLEVDPFRPAAGVSIDTALAFPAAVFHYVGHTDADNGHGYLVREVIRHAGGVDLDRLYSDRLAVLLCQAGVKLALFSACNSGYRAFVAPLLEAGLPALVGVQGIVTNVTTERFCDVLYRFLAVGLSLDEAVTAARAALFQSLRPGERDSFDWGRLMVYLPASEALLLPRPDSEDVRGRKAEARREREQIIVNVYGDYIAGDQVGGDRIAVGAITDAKGVAIGGGAQASVTDGAKPPGSNEPR